MNRSLVRAAKRCHEKRGLAWAFRESVSRLFGRPLTPEAAERTKQLNARWTSSSGYCIPTAMTAEAPPRLERWQGHRNGYHANRTLKPQKRKECKSVLRNRRQPDRRLEAGTPPPSDRRLGFEEQEIYDGKGGHN